MRYFFFRKKRVVTARRTFESCTIEFGDKSVVKLQVDSDKNKKGVIVSTLLVLVVKLVLSMLFGGTS